MKFIESLGIFLLVCACMCASGQEQTEDPVNPTQELLDQVCVAIVQEVESTQTPEDQKEHYPVLAKPARDGLIFRAQNHRLLYLVRESIKNKFPEASERTIQRRLETAIHWQLLDQCEGMQSMLELTYGPCPNDNQLLKFIQSKTEGFLVNRLDVKDASYEAILEEYQTLLSQLIDNNIDFIQEAYSGDYNRFRRDVESFLIHKSWPYYRLVLGAEREDKNTTTLRQLTASLGTYSGKKKNEQSHGIGSFLWYTGSLYVGEWKNGVRSGVGELQLVSGDQCIAEFENDSLHGLVLYTFKDQTVHLGYYEDGKPHGIGIRRWKNNRWDGDYYIGEWRFGEINGMGKYYDKSTNVVRQGFFTLNGSLLAEDFTSKDSVQITLELDKKLAKLEKALAKIKSQLPEVVKEK